MDSQQEQSRLYLEHDWHLHARDGGHERGNLLAAYEEACYQRDAALNSAMAMLNRAALEQTLRENDAAEKDRRSSEYAHELLANASVGADEQRVSEATYSIGDRTVLEEAQKEIERQRQRIETLKLAVHQEEDYSLRAAYQAACRERDDAVNRAGQMVDREAWNSLHTLYHKVCYERDAAVKNTLKNLGLITRTPLPGKVEEAENTRARLKAGLARHTQQMVMCEPDGL
jgi:hypothetical protein